MSTRKLQQGSLLGLLAVWILVLPFSVQAKVEIGDAMPNFTLQDTKGKTHSLSDYNGKLIVLDFTCHECPFAVDKDKTLADISKDFRSQGVVFLGIESSKNTTVEDIQVYTTKTGIEHPILKDVDNLYADKVNAKRTPEIFILDKEGKLAYHGAYDNREDWSTQGDTIYIVQSLDALLKGEAVPKDRTKPYGCTIKRKSTESSTSKDGGSDSKSDSGSSSK